MIKNILVLVFILTGFHVSAQKVEFEMVPGTKITYREVANLTRRINSKYIGLVSKEEQGILVTKDYGNTYNGTFFISRDLKHDARFVERPLDKTVQVKLSYNISTGFTVKNGSAHPRLQGFPVFPDRAVAPGEKWTGYSVRNIDPLKKDMPTAVRFYCEYTYVGPVNHNGRKAEKIHAKYALRYKNEYGNGDPDLVEIRSAGHEVDIFVYDDTGAMMIIDKLSLGRGRNEEYRYRDKTVIEQSGTIITWLNAAVIMDKKKIIKEFIDKYDEPEKSKIPDDDGPGIINLGDEDIEIREADEGLKLELKNIHFVPDSDVILKSEKKRLDVIAGMLKKIPERTVLVIGHTARVGLIDNEKLLSENRAKAIVAEMVKRGIPAKRFIYQGRGGTEPLGDNNTEKGRKMNRRVEIIILED